MSRRARRSSADRRRWWIVGLVAFLLLDAGLVWWAVAATRGASDDKEPLPMTAFAPAPTAKPATTPSSPTPTPTLAAIVLEPMARRLVPLDAVDAWRTPSVACGAPATIDWSGDGGASWTSWSAGEDAAGVREIVGYTGDPSTVGIVASLAGDCRPEYRISFTGGEFWASYPDEQPELIMIDPADAGAIVGPGGSVASPCGPVSEFAFGAAGVGVLCTSTEVRIGPPDMSSWTAVSTAGAAVAITNSGDGYLLATRRDPDCVGGVRLSTVGIDGAVAPGACQPGLVDETAPVTIATADDGAIWLWVGDQVRVSTDGGASWTGA